MARILALFDAQNDPAGTLHLNRRAISSSDKAKMSFNVGSEIATANHFVGLVGGQQRAEIHEGVVNEDNRRRFWISHMLPVLTEEFLDKVIAEPYVRFRLHGEDPNLKPRHTAIFQSFAYLCAPLPTIAARHMPWQFRFILAKDKRDVLDSSLATDNTLRSQVFDKAGWVFWITTEGFCLAPKTICEELSDISAMQSAWLKVRNDFEFSPPVAARYWAEEQELGTEAVPEPPKLERKTE